MTTPAQTPNLGVGAPIPEGATVGAAIPAGATVGQPAANVAVGAPIPEGATVGSAIPAGATVGKPARLTEEQQDQQVRNFEFDKQGAIAKAFDLLSTIRPEDIPDEKMRNDFRMAKVGLGAVKSAGQTVHTVASAIHHPAGVRTLLAANPMTAALAFSATDEQLSKVGEVLSPKQGIDELGKKTELHGIEEHAGAAGEMVLEFMLGEEALKTLSLGQRMKTLAPLLEQLEKYPRLMKAVTAGIKSGAIGTGQAMMHGASPAEALTAGAVTGVTGSAGEAAGGAITDALQARQAANATAKATTEGLAAESQQAGAVATDARATANAATDKLRTAEQGVTEARAAAPEKISELATSADKSYRAGAQTSWIRSNMGAKAADFGEAADLAQQEAKPLFAKVDAASNGKYTELRTALNRAWKARDMAKVDEVEHSMDELFHMDFGKGVVSEGDAAAAREAWRTSKTLEGLHRVMEQSFSGPSAELAGRTGVPRTFVGGPKMQTQVRTLVEKVGQDEVERVIGKDGLNNLVKLADATSKPTEQIKYARVMEQTAREAERQAARASKAVESNASKQAASAGATTPTERILRWASRKTVAGGVGAIVGTAVGGPLGGKVGSVAGIVTDELARKAWQTAATNPRIGKLVIDAVKLGTDPKVYAPLIVRAITQEMPDEVKQAGKKAKDNLNQP
jgi:hypothetical protein